MCSTVMRQFSIFKKLTETPIIPYSTKFGHPHFEDKDTKRVCLCFKSFYFSNQAGWTECWKLSGSFTFKPNPFTCISISSLPLHSLSHPSFPSLLPSLPPSTCAVEPGCFDQQDESLKVEQFTPNYVIKQGINEPPPNTWEWYVYKLSGLISLSQPSLTTHLVMYRVFIKYCVFFKDFKIFWTFAFLCFPSSSLCVHTPGR